MTGEQSAQVHSSPPKTTPPSFSSSLPPTPKLALLLPSHSPQPLVSLVAPSTNLTRPEAPRSPQKLPHLLPLLLQTRQNNRSLFAQTLIIELLLIPHVKETSQFARRLFGDAPMIRQIVLILQLAHVLLALVGEIFLLRCSGMLG